MIDIFRVIYENKDSNLTLYSVLKKAFNENDNIKLLKLRCETIRELEALEEELNLEKEEIEVLNDLKILLLQSNLDRPIREFSNLITKAHFVALKTIYRLFETSLNLQTKIELEEIYKNLPKEDKEFLNELKTALDDFFIEFRVKGNRAYKSLYLRVIGILALYKEDIKNSKHKDIFASVLQKAEFGVKFTESLTAIANNSKRLLEILF